ncbi:MAG: 50S ribosomal protein L25 [Chloroflexi bacterium]|nr:MAG: 50S ribosomal protein L25 [Chloroflexota bacterium]
MPDTYVAQARTALGKAATKLRREGTLPGNIYGRALQSQAVQMSSRDVIALLKAHGPNTLIQLQVEGEPQARSVVVRGVQRHPVNQTLVHVDFYQVDISRRIQAHLPVMVIGEAPAVQIYAGVLLLAADTVIVEALPAEMPTHVEVSVDSITEIDGAVTVADLILPAGVTVLTPASVMLARVTRGRVAPALPGAAVAEGAQKP